MRWQLCRRKTRQGTGRCSVLNCRQDSLLEIPRQGKQGWTVHDFGRVDSMDTFQNTAGRGQMTIDWKAESKERGKEEEATVASSSHGATRNRSIHAELASLERTKGLKLTFGKTVKQCSQSSRKTSRRTIKRGTGQ